MAGTAFSNFGAFFDERWRTSDITWGRLDAAEFLIGAMVPPGDARTALIARAHAAICASEGTTTAAMKDGVATRPPLDRQAANTIAGRAAIVLGRLVSEVQRDRPRVPLLGPASGVATALGTLLTWLVAATSTTSALMRHASTLAGIAFDVLFVLGLVSHRPEWRFVGAAGLAIAWLWDVMTWGYRSFVARRPAPALVLAGLGLLKLVITVLAVAVSVVVAVAIAAALGAADGALVQSTRAAVEHVRTDHQALYAFLVGVALLVLGVVLALGRARAHERAVDRVAERGVEAGGGDTGRNWNARWVATWHVLVAYAGAVVMCWVAVGHVAPVHP